MAETVRAVVQTGPRQMEMRAYPRPVIGPDDGALLRVEACGICGSDVEQYKGALGTRGLPMIPGHEPLGVIEEISEQTARRWGVSAGDRVAVEIMIPCRSCDRCLAGRYINCKSLIGSHGGGNPPERQDKLTGGYAEYMELHPNSIVHPVRADIPAEIAVMYNPLGAGVRWALEYGGVRLGSSVLVLGAGQRGLAAILAARYVGAGLIIATGLGKDAKKLELAREFGADHTINVEEEDTVTRLRELTGGDGVDVVLDLTPMAQQPVRDAIDAARWGGTIVVAGLKGHKDIPIPTDMLIGKSLTLKGAFSVNASGYADAIRLIESGRLPLEKMQTHQYGLDDVEHAIKLLAGEIPGEEGIHVAIRPGLLAAIRGGCPETRARSMSSVIMCLCRPDGSGSRARRCLADGPQHERDPAQRAADRVVRAGRPGADAPVAGRLRSVGRKFSQTSARVAAARGFRPCSWIVGREREPRIRSG